MMRGDLPPSCFRHESNVGASRRFALPTSISELQEPEVSAMMLVGLILLGYRARRHSSEKFK
ncbi:hypothetical protein [Massilia litorea]|jgi:hypothetical protein|uniref:PEP-CTERM protein-sorting domain-containing protein n=1 Tax=Massilia litorea TaxID=2769491 RepID=A0A7L9UD97_9BURK|nr:hypothetical protein [Massilia litorea]QOL52202.1 hypothetical protein LPB04_09245 [Massilia litorea]